MHEARQDSFSVPPIQLADRFGNLLVDCPGLVLKRGGLHAITGPSGAGKTLFLHHLFFQERFFDPRKGEVLMLQDPGEGLTPHLRIGHQVKDLSIEAAESHPVFREFWKRFPASLSGGERQKVMAALVFGSNPSVLVCDEPAANLSREQADRLFDVIMEERKRRDFTFLFVTHDWSRIEAIADSVLYFEKGKPIRQVAKDELPAFEPFVLWKNWSSSGVQDLPNVERTGFPEISVENLEFSYGRHVVFDHFNWTSKGGSWWWVQGPNGVGKSTFAKLLCGLLQPVKGRILLEGNTVNLMSRTQRRSVQYTFQVGRHLFNPVQPMGRQLMPYFRGNRNELRKGMEQLGLPFHLLDVRPGTLSLGEAQRFNLLRAMASHPKILIVDEGFANLDITSRIRLLELLLQVQQELKCTLIVIGHDETLPRLYPGQILNLADK